MFVCSWLRNLNEYGVCLLTDVSTEMGTVEKVYSLSLSLSLSPCFCLMGSGSL
jgi:hypothetical protein